MIFKLDNSNEVLETSYHNDNYRIINGYAHNGKCIVFISSNGLYYPNTYEEFFNKVVFIDRYEWENVANELMFSFEKLIFIRDVRKNFYVTGINIEINSINLLIGWIKEKTLGYETYLVGGSAGGYLALTIANEINAAGVFESGGQVNLYEYGEVLNSYYWLKNHRANLNYTKYYNLSLVLENNKTPIIHVFSVRNTDDLYQYKIMRDFPNLHFLPIDSDKHGTTLQYTALITLLKTLGNARVLEWIDDMYAKFIQDGICENADGLSDKFFDFISPENERHCQSEIEKIYINEIRCGHRYENVITSADIPARLSGKILLWGYGTCGKKFYASMMEKRRKQHEINLYVYDKNNDIPEDVLLIRDIDLEDFVKLNRDYLTVIISVQNNIVRKDIAEILTQKYGLMIEQILFYKDIKK